MLGHSRIVRRGGLKLAMFRHLVAISLMITTVLSNTQGSGQDECCKRKQVGSTFYVYDFYFDNSTESIKTLYDCDSNCVYYPESQPDLKYCFRLGGEPSECVDDSTPTTYSVITTSHPVMTTRSPQSGTTRRVPRSVIKNNFADLLKPAGWYKRAAISEDERRSWKSSQAPYFDRNFN